MNDERIAFNQQVIEEFRASGGKPGGPYESTPLLLLHHIGVKSGTEYTTPLAYLPDGDDWVLFAANGGRSFHPGWYFNLKATQNVVIEVGEDTVQVTVREAEGEERETLFAREREVSPLFAEFERKTTRQIPVLVLSRT